MSAQVPVLGGKGGGSGWGGDLSGFICQADTAAELWPRSWRNRRACVTCAGARLRKEGLSNKSRKSKITPVRINSGRGEIVKIGLVRQPPRFRTVFRYSFEAGRNTIMPLGRFDKSGNAMSVAGRTPGAVLRVPDTLTDFCPVIWLRAAASIGSLRSPSPFFRPWPCGCRCTGNIRRPCPGRLRRRCRWKACSTR